MGCVLCIVQQADFPGCASQLQQTSPVHLLLSVAPLLLSPHLSDNITVQPPLTRRGHAANLLHEHTITPPPAPHQHTSPSSPGGVRQQLVDV
jgi:hypothetical protein